MLFHFTPLKLNKERFTKTCKFNNDRHNQSNILEENGKGWLKKEWFTNPESSNHACSLNLMWRHIKQKLLSNWDDN